MGISKKRAPVIPGSPDVERAFSQLYDDLNEVINSVNQGNTTDVKETKDGKSGDIRLIKDSKDDKYYLEAKSDEGWIRSDNQSTSGFVFRDK